MVIFEIYSSAQWSQQNVFKIAFKMLLKYFYQWDVTECMFFRHIFCIRIVYKNEFFVRVEICFSLIILSHWWTCTDFTSYNMKNDDFSTKAFQIKNLDQRNTFLLISCDIRNENKKRKYISEIKASYQQFSSLFQTIFKINKWKNNLLHAHCAMYIYLRAKAKINI